jgi:NAD(P)-dependent dehydrogenase (short-subunit alcohol dehydrogenase family)
VDAEWSDKSFLLVGASCGIGMVVCRELLKRGALVTAVTRQAASLTDLLIEFPRTLRVLQKDLHEPGVGLAVAAELSAALSGFVYAAGILKISPLKFYKQADFHSVMRINCEAYLEICQALLRKSKLLPGSSVVAVSSVMENHAVAGNGLYAASKAALSAASRVLACELARDRIRVNTVSPGALDTGMTNQVSGMLSPGAADKHSESYLLGVGKPSDVAGLIVFLLSQSSRWITGTTSVVDGGFSSL